MSLKFASTFPRYPLLVGNTLGFLISLRGAPASEAFPSHLPEDMSPFPEVVTCPILKGETLLSFRGSPNFKVPLFLFWAPSSSLEEETRNVTPSLVLFLARLEEESFELLPQLPRTWRILWLERNFERQSKSTVFSRPSETC